MPTEGSRPVTPDVASAGTPDEAAAYPGVDAAWKVETGLAEQLLLDPVAASRRADVLPDGVLIADAGGRVEVCNTLAARLLDTRIEDALGQPLAEVLRLQDQDGRSWLEVNRPFTAIGITTGAPEQSWLLPSGGEVLVTTRLLRDAPRTPITGICLSLRSGRGRARLDQERSDLVATVAHELRSPLTGVKGFVQALLNRWEKLNDEQKRLMLTTVNADADRLSRLITELLDVARIDTGRLSLYPRPSDVGVLLHRVVDSVAVGTARPVELDVADGLPEVLLDPDKFTQVITNLVENGVRHGEGTVRVRAGLHVDADAVEITVTDEGEGIPAEMRRRVFTKFWKHGARGGSGLGLYIVNGLTQAHGGRIEIEDAPGGGTLIRVVWPIGELPDA